MHHPPTVEVVGMDLPTITSGLDAPSIPAIDPSLEADLPGLPAAPEMTSARISAPELSRPSIPQNPSVASAAPEPDDGDDLLDNLPGLPDLEGMSSGGLTEFEEDSVSLPNAPRSAPLEVSGNDPFADDARDPFKLADDPDATSLSPAEHRFSLDERPAAPPPTAPRADRIRKDSDKPQKDEVNLDALEIIQPDSLEAKAEDSQKTKAVRAYRAEFQERKGRVAVDWKVVAAVGAFVVLIGVILGQTSAGYFGVNLFGSKKKPPPPAPQRLRFDRVDAAFRQDTPAAYLQAIRTLTQFKQRQGGRDEVIVRWALALAVYGEKFLLNGRQLSELNTTVRGRIGLPDRYIFLAYVDLLVHRPDLALEHLEAYRKHGKGVKPKPPTTVRPKKRSAPVKGSKTPPSGIKTAPKKRPRPKPVAVKGHAIKPIRGVYDPRFELAYVEGRAQIHRRQYKLALAAFNRALKIDPKSTRALYESARAALFLKRSGIAVKRLKRALKLSPNHGLARVALLQPLLIQRKFTELRKKSTDLLKTLRSTQAAARSHAYVLIADSYLMQEQVEEGDKQLELAYKANTNDEALTLRVAELSLKQGYLGDAQRKLTNCQAKGCRSARFFVLVARVHLRSNRYAQAKKALEHGQKLFPNDVELKYEHARMEEQKGRLSLALQFYRTITTSHPEFASAYFALAKLLKARHEIPAMVE
ncbi:MAG: tetratricopeptide repeat protein, partial [Myxococcales bacterium]|nr:tetratricopeptide repeat protein [Myxococcales bacterium]